VTFCWTTLDVFNFSRETAAKLMQTAAWAWAWFGAAGREGGRNCWRRRLLRYAIAHVTCLKPLSPLAFRFSYGGTARSSVDILASALADILSSLFAHYLGSSAPLYAQQRCCRSCLKHQHAWRALAALRIANFILTHIHRGSYLYSQRISCA